MDLISNLVIDRVLRIGGLSLTDGELLWMGNQVSACTINSTQENTAATDAVGLTISYISRSKGLDISATSKTFDFGIAAAQWGSERKISSADSTIIGTVFDEHELTAAEITAGIYNLKHTPRDTGTTPVAGTGLKYIYKLNKLGNQQTKYTYGAQASATAFSYTTGAKAVTLPTGAFAAGDVVLAAYEYTADGTDIAMSIISDAKKYPTSCKGLVECLFRDKCDDSLVYGYFITPKCKLDGNFSADLSTDGTHDFKLLAESDYCGANGSSLVQVFVPNCAS